MIYAKIRYGTTAGQARYYRVGTGCKKLHPRLLVLLRLSLARAQGTTVPEVRYYREHLWYYRARGWYYRKGLRYYCSREQYYRMLQFSNTRKPSFCIDKERRRMLQRSKGKVVQKGVNVYVMIPPKPFQSGPPLNSTAFLRLKSTEKKRRETPSSIVFEGHQTVLCLVMICLKYSMHMISPQKHCHQSQKQLRDNMPLQSPPFWWIDDNTGFA